MHYSLQSRISKLCTQIFAFNAIQTKAVTGAAPIWRTQVKKDIEQLNAYE